MALLLTFIICVIVGQLFSIGLGLMVERYSTPYTGLLTFMASYFAMFWIAWRLAVRITEPRSRLAADTAKAGAPGRRPGSSHEMQVCRTFGRNHLSRSVL